MATGAGAHGRVLLGLAVFGGMLAASVIAIFLIPVTFYVVESLVHRGKPHGESPIVSPPSQQLGDGELSHSAPRPALSPTHARESESY
jgi:HAE1 family hydrophobic/amphiphilic exporter-1